MTSRKKAFLWLGDSISESATGVVGTSYPTTCRPCSIQDSYPARWARANGFLLQNIAQSNLYARDWAVTSADRWNRTDLAAGKFDGAFIAAGSNDYANNRSLAQYQADVATIISKIRDTIGADKPIYLVDIMPTTDASIRESLRT
ncbi:SGNH/GDSL hydrolase family protein [Rhodococcus erythropolis]|uniref:SGNH/GDSL hydrolase family protein n=1 Tax=Rhodococcus erythropolis TaxID=1833 RepID=UPI002948F30D|nr:SGNH/GDSL hydrolase family protein [Rhodococcus erythropolis]MDV6212477.1 SGNH/GDSL hydrolase family protein [Rhodococcus erythropolis]